MICCTPAPMCIAVSPIPDESGSRMSVTRCGGNLTPMGREGPVNLPGQSSPGASNCLRSGNYRWRGMNLPRSEGRHGADPSPGSFASAPRATQCGGTIAEAISQRRRRASTPTADARPEWSLRPRRCAASPAVSLCRTGFLRAGVHLSRLRPGSNLLRRPRAACAPTVIASSRPTLPGEPSRPDQACRAGTAVPVTRQ